MLKTCERAGLDSDKSKAMALAMYAEPTKATSFLSKLNQSQSAQELRKYLIIRCFDNFSEGDQPEQNIFMHPSSANGEGHGGIFSENWDDHHSSGDFGGGHH